MAYDSAVVSFTIKTDKVDLVAAAHINTIQAELVIIETILGTGVKGDRADLKTRLNNALDADGSIFSGTSYPSPALPSQMFYRTDLDLMSVRNAANSTWNPIGQNLSNLLWCFGMDTNAGSTTDYGPRSTATQVDGAPAALSYKSLFNKTTTYQTLWSGKVRKLAGQTTATIWLRVARFNTGTASYQVTIGGQAVEITYDSATVGWASGTINISGLTNDTTYDATIEVKSGNANDAAHLYSSMAIAS